MLGKVKRSRKITGYSLADDATAHLFGAHVSGCERVTPNNCETISAVFNAVTVITQGVARLPLLVYKKNKGGGKLRADTNPVYDLFHRAPNSFMTPFEFKEMMVGHLLLRGDFFALKWISPRSGIELLPMHPDRVHVYLDPSSGLTYEYQDQKQGNILFGQDEIFHVKGLRSDGRRGKSIITVGEMGLTRARSADNYAGEYFENSATPLGILKYPKALDDEVYDRLKGDWESKHKGGGNRHRVAILEEGLEWQQLGINNRDSQFLESRQFEITEIARWFNLPPHKIKDLSHATFSNIEHQGAEFHQDSILPWCTRIQEHVSRCFFSNQKGLFAEFLYDSLLITDTISRYNAHKMAINDGWKTRNEVRVIENLNPEPGLDEYLVPLNMTTAGDQVVTQVDPSQAPDPQPQDPAARALKTILKECFQRCVTAEVKSIERALKSAEPAKKIDAVYQDLPEKMGNITGVPLETLAEYFGVIESRTFADRIVKNWIDASQDELRSALVRPDWDSNLKQILTNWGNDRAAIEVNHCINQVEKWKEEAKKAA